VSDILSAIQSQWASLASGLNRWRLMRWATLLPKIAALEPTLQSLGDEQLRKRSLSLRYRAKSGEPLARLLVEAYALVREAARRTIKMRHFDVQMLGGIAMFHRSIVEMQTGEGKTLTATLPLYLHGLLGKGCHLATVNDYLARRDAEWMRPVYEALGMTVGVIETDMSQGLCLRHRLWHRQGVRLRFSPRSAAAATHQRGPDGPARRNVGQRARGHQREARPG
jgi:preprotein translocase subunit SecA